MPAVSRGTGIGIAILGRPVPEGITKGPPGALGRSNGGGGDTVGDSDIAIGEDDNDAAISANPFAGNDCVELVPEKTQISIVPLFLPKF